MSGGCARAERRRAERQKRMAEVLMRRKFDPLAVNFGRAMSEPAVRERCVGLKAGDSTTADIAEGFNIVVTRLEGGELAIATVVKWPTAT